MQLQLCQKDTLQISWGPVIHQTPFWTNLKEKQGFETLAFEISVKYRYDYLQKDSKADEDLLIIIRKIGPNACMACIPYGPIIYPKEEFQGR